MLHDWWKGRKTRFLEDRKFLHRKTAIAEEAKGYRTIGNSRGEFQSQVWGPSQCDSQQAAQVPLNTPDAGQSRRGGKKKKGAQQRKGKIQSTAALKWKQEQECCKEGTDWRN